MRIRPNQQIAGRPAREIRDFCYRMYQHWFDCRYVAETMKVSERKAREIIRTLQDLGYLTESEYSDRRKRWKITDQGRRLSLASAAPPLSRARAEQKMKEFLQRVEEVNRDDYYLYRVVRVTVFGSFNRKTDRLGDIDLAVDLAPKIADKDRKQALETQRSEEARSQGRRFANYLDYLCWPEHEVLLFLKARSRCFHLTSSWDPALKRCKKRIVFENKTDEGAH